ncbi:MAG: hypothetical protein ACK480_02500, partial [Planctomycetota bacterium]
MMLRIFLLLKDSHLDQNVPQGSDTPAFRRIKNPETLVDNLREGDGIPGLEQRSLEGFRSGFFQQIRTGIRPRSSNCLRPSRIWS